MWAAAGGWQCYTHKCEMKIVMLRSTSSVLLPPCYMYTRRLLVIRSEKSSCRWNCPNKTAHVRINLRKSAMIWNNSVWERERSRTKFLFMLSSSNIFISISVQETHFPTICMDSATLKPNPFSFSYGGMDFI